MAKGKTNTLSMIGFWAFIVGLIIALIVGIMSGLGMAPATLMTVIIIVLIVLGIIIGLLNITASEILLFLVATIALVVVGNAFAQLTVLKIGAILGGILSLVAALMAPAAIIAAIKALWKIGKPGD